MRERTLALFLLLALILCCPLSAQNIKINEVNTNLDYIEICNLDVGPVDISGFQVIYFEDTQNPGGSPFQFPGTAGSGTVILQPDECVILTDSSTFAHPIVPVGTQIFFYGLNILWNVGEAGSCVLGDASGNGLDYYAHGNPNMLLAPFETGTTFGQPAGALTAFTGNASPDCGGANTLDVHHRNSRVDTDTGADFTMRADPMDSPGVLNPFQSLIDGDGMPPVADFTPSATMGGAPLTVDFTNTSTGDCQLVTLVWDFDAVMNPGAMTDTKNNPCGVVFPSRAGTPPGGMSVYDVNLTLIDACGGAVTSPNQQITAIEPAGITPQSLGFRETFEGPIGANGTSATDVNGWDIRLASGVSRVRTIDPRTDGAVAGYTDANPGSGPTVAIMDVNLNSNLGVSELILHIDGDAIATAQSGVGDFRVRFYLYHNLDELHPEDVIVFQDGVTAGNGVDRTAASTGAPGTDGFQEIFLLDPISSLPGSRTWAEFEVAFDSNFFTNNGLVPPGSGQAGDYRLIFRHNDNFMFNGGDGLLIDDVRILGQSVPGNGEPGLAGAALMDINGATNANGSAVGDPFDPNGPFFATAIAGGALNFRFEGETDQPIVYLIGPLNPGAAVYPAASGGTQQFDIGGPVDMNGVPTLLTLVANGTNPGNLIDLLFNTGPTGVQTITFNVPSIPPGTNFASQAIIFNSIDVVRFTNAVDLTFL